jgi:hypothetical protein
MVSHDDPILPFPLPLGERIKVRGIAAVEDAT